MKCDASESSDPDSKLQQVDLRMLEMGRGICSVIRAKQSSLCSLSLSVGRSARQILVQQRSAAAAG